MRDVLTVLAPFTAEQLAPADLEAWRKQRRTLRASQPRARVRRSQRNTE
jgi:DNA-directed RNA polymerase